MDDEVPEEAGPGILTGTSEDGAGVGGSFVRERRDVEAAEAVEDAAGAVGIGDFVGVAHPGDVDLEDDETGVVVEGQGLYVLVDDFGVMGGVELGGESGEAQGREEGVLDGAEEGAGGFGEGGEDELHSHRDST